MSNRPSSRILWSVRVPSRSVNKGFVQSRARGVLVPETETSSREIRASAPHSQSVAFPTPQGNWIAARSSPWLRRLAGKLERSGPYGARFPAIFSSPYKGPCGLLIRIWAGSQVTAGKCFSLVRALLKHCQEPRSRIFGTFSLSPVHVLSSFASCHGKHHDSRSVGNAQIRIGEVRNVLR